MRKKILAIVLSVAVTLALIPCFSFAAGNEIELLGINLPAAGEAPATSASATDSNITVTSVKWEAAGKTFTGAAFEECARYYAYITVKSTSKFDADEPPAIIIGGEKFYPDDGDSCYATVSSDGYTCKYEITCGVTGVLGTSPKVFAIGPDGGKRSTYAILSDETDIDTYYSIRGFNFTPVDYAWYKGDKLLFTTDNSYVEFSKLPCTVGMNTFRCVASSSDGKSAEVEITIKYVINLYYEGKITVKNVTYNGKSGRLPSVTVKYGKKTLKKGTDYTICAYEAASVRKGVGTYHININGKGNYVWTPCESDDWEDYYLKFKINPKKTSIRSLTKGKKSFTVKYYKRSEKMNTKHITGYQVQYATNSKFTKGKKNAYVKGYSTTVRTVKKLKSKKKYYVHVRTYMEKSGKRYYSPWSATKAVTTK